MSTDYNLEDCQTLTDVPQTTVAAVTEDPNDASKWAVQVWNDDSTRFFGDYTTEDEARTALETAGLWEGTPE